MHTTLYRSIALLISMCALTSSFSLSTSPHKSERDKVSWIVEYAWGVNLAKFQRDKNGTFDSSDDNHFISKVKSFLYSHPDLKLNNLYAAFKVYKEGKEQQIIGLVFNKIKNNKKYSEKLALYDKDFKPLNNPYTALIAGRKVNFKESPLNYVLHREDRYVFSMQWQEPNQYYKNLKVSYDKRDQIQIDDKEKPKWKDPNQYYKNLKVSSYDKRDQIQITDSSPLNWKIIGFAVVGLALVIYTMYSEGCCSYLFKKSSQKR